jgi:hypothetical protein
MRYLYAEPSLQSSNLLSFTSALTRGHRKWSDLNIHPHSLPGRYISTLDLSHLDEGYPSLHPITISRAAQEIFPLIPNLRHLVLPNRSPITFDDIWMNRYGKILEFAKNLRCLEGVNIDLMMVMNMSGREVKWIL